MPLFTWSKKKIFKKNVKKYFFFRELYQCNYSFKKFIFSWTKSVFRDGQTFFHSFFVELHLVTLFLEFLPWSPYSENWCRIAYKECLWFLLKISVYNMMVVNLSYQINSSKSIQERKITSGAKPHICKSLSLLSCVVFTKPPIIKIKRC